MEVFLIGAPKAGTTWLSHVLDQHPEITLSSPKEPNLVATHKGTFAREDEEPDWEEYSLCFSGEGMKLDASVHTFGCPVAPIRIRERFPEAVFILCLREPVSRTVSHWNMVRNTGEAKKNGRDWDSFERAWTDECLRVDSLYGSSMKRWIAHFDLSRFIILDSSRMRREPEIILREIEGFLDIDNWSYDLNMNRHSNSAAGRRPISLFGRMARVFFSVIPRFIKSPIVSFLKKKDLNIYRLPLLSRKGVFDSLDDRHYAICGEELFSELVLFESLTGFDASVWKKLIERRSQ